MLFLAPAVAMMLRLTDKKAIVDICHLMAPQLSVFYPVKIYQIGLNSVIFCS